MGLLKWLGLRPPPIPEEDRGAIRREREHLDESVNALKKQADLLEATIAETERLKQEMIEAKKHGAILDAKVRTVRPKGKDADHRDAG